MKITEFAQTHLPKAKVNAEISERWQKRVVGNGWHVRGRAGAEAYIGQYLKGAGVAKVMAFASAALAEGYKEFSDAMVEHAFFLETGKRERMSGATTAVLDVVVTKSTIRTDFGMQPHLPTVVDWETASVLLRSGLYGVQEKKDGRHLMVRVTRDGAITGGSKAGLVTNVPLTIADAVAPLRFADIDGEDVNGVFYAFDLIAVGGRDLTGESVEDRHSTLVALTAPFLSHNFHVLPIFTGTAALEFVEQLKAEGKEGFVLKKLKATYGEAETMWKHQFRAQSAFIAGGRNGEKSSVELFVVREDGSRRSMGFVTVKANQQFPEPGDIVEVKYLYAFRDGKLAQPELLCIRRDDTRADDCTENKLKIKSD